MIVPSSGSTIQTRPRPVVGASPAAEGESQVAPESPEYAKNVALMERLLVTEYGAAAGDAGSEAPPAETSKGGDTTKKPKRAKKQPPPSRVKRTAARKAKREAKE